MTKGDRMEIMTAKQHRLAQGYSIRELAKMANVSTQTVVSLEKGNRIRPGIARKIADALGIEPMQIREYRESILNERSSS